MKIKTLVVVGSSSRIGQALAAKLNFEQTLFLDRQIYAGWSSGHDGVTEARKFFDDFNEQQLTVIVAAGITSAYCPTEELEEINFKLPANIHEALNGRRARLVTIGTAMERMQPNQNEYVKSKTRLGQMCTQANDKNWLHIRLHTIYGGREPNKGMFLGQILASLNSSAPFVMSSGFQFREYQNLDDISLSAGQLILGRASGVQEICYGMPIRLRQLAAAVFQAFGKLDSLHFNSSATSNLEILEPKLFVRTNTPAISHDEVIQGIVDWLSKFVNPKS